jgi:periplasmic protein TonB
MSYQALLFCPDEKTARVVTQVLTELDFTVEPCNETFSAVKKLMAQHFDAIVVDCDNEQNATLLFKSARNSAPNQNSLAVAVVEGQAGVAKAFRIGANLVLTKPINVEQSKGTLRVARGLLRKADAAKPSAPPSGPQIVAPPVPSFDKVRPVSALSIPTKAVTPFPATNAAQAPGVPEMTAAGFEVEEEESPKPEAAEVALLESLPDPLATSRKSSQASTFSSKELPWQPISAPAPPKESVTAEVRVKTTENQAKPAYQALSFGPSKRSSDAPIASVPTSRTGSAAAAAPAKEPVRPEKTVETRITPKQAEVTTAHTEAPIFSSMAGNDPATASASRNRKPFLYVAAIVLAAAAYFGWVKMHAGPASSQPASQVTTPAPTPAQVPAAEPAASIESSSAIAAPASSPVIAPDTTTHSPAPGSLSGSGKPSAATKIAGTETATSSVPTESPVASEPRSFVVKSENTRPEAPKPVALEPAQPVAPGALGIAANSDEKAIAGIISSVPARVPIAAPQHVRVSQGVSQGLLAKRVQPVYPSQAMQMRLQGAVLLDAKIGKDGSIVSVKRVSGDALLARAATDAVKQWKYKPYYLNGEPVEIDTEITVNFKLP